MKAQIALPPSLFVTGRPLAIPEAVCFRLAQRGDLASWRANCYPQQPFRVASRRFQAAQEQQQAGRAYQVVAEQPSPATIVASGRIILYPDTAEIADLVVAAAYQNQGIGTALITILVNIARHRGYEAVEIGVTADNVRALALYRRLGFHEDRRLRLPGEDEAIILLQEW